MSIKEMIHEIEEASADMLVPKHENHLAKELLQDLLDKAMTEEEIHEILIDKELENRELDI